MYIRIERHAKDFAWYRKQGRYCFDFVTIKNVATNLTEAEAIEILKHKDYYLKMFGADKMIIES